jgi:1,4-alpha-glucan branching enzyme
MLRKEFLIPSQRVRVIFELPDSIWATSVALIGDFNDWDPRQHLMQQREDGTWTIAVELAAGQSYEFRYLIDGAQSSAEWSADGLTSHCGTMNSVITT